MSASHSPYLPPAAHQHSRYQSTHHGYLPPATDPAGRHRRTESQTSSMLDAVTRLGSMVSLSALLVIGGAVSSLAAPTDGDGAAATAITYELSPAGSGH